MSKLQLFLFLLLPLPTAAAQETPAADTLGSAPRFNSRDSLERLTEQVGDIEESPLLDLLEEMIPRTSIESRSRLSQKLQPARGFSEGQYLGSPVKSYQRVHLRHADAFQAGVLFEKDAGERRYDDFVAGYLRVSNLGPVRSIVIGDYFVEAGQGVALWRGYDYQKGADVVTPVVRRHRGLLPYLSSGETGFFRGAAAIMEFAPLTVTTFISKKDLTGTVDEEGNITSVPTAGYFRTAAEEEKRNSFTETVTGFHARVEGPFGAAGVTGYASRYDRFLDLSGGGPGNRFTMLSADVAAGISHAKIFGEWGIAKGLGGGISGIQLSPGDGVSIVAAFRRNPGIQGLHGNGFGERPGGPGERGFYLGLEASPVRRVHLSTYFDMFSFENTSSSSVYTDGGHEILAAGKMKPVPHLGVDIRYRRKVTVEKGSGFDQYGRVTQLDDRKTDQDFRLSVEYSVNPRTSLRSRVEYTNLVFRFQERQEHGLLLYQDLLMGPSELFRFNARIVFFRTDSYDSGIAEFERDLDGVLTVPVLYGRGVRWYLLAHYTISDALFCSLKYSETIRDDVRTIGTGLDELPGNRDNRIGLQLDFML